MTDLIVSYTHLKLVKWLNFFPHGGLYTFAPELPGTVDGVESAPVQLRLYDPTSVMHLFHAYILQGAS